MSEPQITQIKRFSQISLTNPALTLLDVHKIIVKYCFLSSAPRIVSSSEQKERPNNTGYKSCNVRKPRDSSLTCGSGSGIRRTRIELYGKPDS